jgi:hypothetical protein
MDHIQGIVHIETAAVTGRIDTLIFRRKSFSIVDGNTVSQIISAPSMQG